MDKILDYQRFVVILFDEMESLVYDKHASQVIGFVELNDVYDKSTQEKKAMLQLQLMFLH